MSYTIPPDEPKTSIVTCSFCIGEGCAYCDNVGSVEVPDEDERHWFNEPLNDDER